MHNLKAANNQSNLVWRINYEHAYAPELYGKTVGKGGMTLLAIGNKARTLVTAHLGLIANELLLNALKHGFNGRLAGKVTVELYGGGRSQMTVRDDGCGFPPAFDARKDAGLGLELVLGMTRQK